MMLICDDFISIRRTEIADIPFVVAVETDEENARYVGQWSAEQHESAFHDDNIFHLILENVSRQAIGYAILRGIDDPNQSVEIMRIVIIDKGKGYGKRALALLKEYCFEVLNAHRVWLDVREHNARAQHVYESQGFIPEGLLRECVWIKDEYPSLIVMSFLRPDYATT